jgi:antitoxin PrlF
MAQAALATPLFFEGVSTVTDKGQTTIPKSVRQALGVNPGDHLAYRVDEQGVTLRRADEAREDPAVAAFLTFLAGDITRNPGNLETFAPDLAKRISDLIGSTSVNPDDPIDGEVAL